MMRKKMMQLKFSVGAIILIVLIAIIAACAGPELKTDVFLISSETVSTLRQREPLSVPLELLPAKEFYLINPENVFFTVTLQVKPTTESKSIDVKNIALIANASDRYYPVGLRIGKGLWDYVFTSGTFNIVFRTGAQKQVKIVCGAQYDAYNSYGIKLKNTEEKNFYYFGQTTQTMDDPTPTLAFVVKQENINGSHFRLEVPGSQPVEVR
jgi:hypothetical protein